MVTSHHPVTNISNSKHTPSQPIKSPNGHTPSSFTSLCISLRSDWSVLQQKWWTSSKTKRKEVGETKKWLFRRNRAMLYKEQSSSHKESTDTWPRRKISKRKRDRSMRKTMPPPQSAITDARSTAAWLSCMPNTYRDRKTHLSLCHTCAPCKLWEMSRAIPRAARQFHEALAQ